MTVLQLRLVFLCMFLTIAAIMGSTFYSNMKVCQAYYPKVSPWVCMMSDKTKVLEK